MEFVPLANFDLVVYTEERGPVVLSLKTSIRERYKQAEFEAQAMKDVHRRAKNFLVTMEKDEAVSLLQHEQEWDEIFAGIHQHVDVVAFQDGHVELSDLQDYLEVNKRLAEKYGMKAWTNTESFDRDMPIKFFPIKFEKLKLKLEAAARAGYEEAITFEFSHFMSPQSAYVQAHHLYNRYMEFINR